MHSVRFCFVSQPLLSCQQSNSQILQVRVFKEPSKSYRTIKWKTPYAFLTKEFGPIKRKLVRETRGQRCVHLEPAPLTRTLLVKVSLIKSPSSRVCSLFFLLVVMTTMTLLVGRESPVDLNDARRIDTYNMQSTIRNIVTSQAYTGFKVIIT